MFINPTRPIDFTTYGECLNQTVKDLGTATPNIQCLKLLAWLFSVPLNQVRADCQEVWERLLKNEFSRGGPGR